jgi:hypothetical protein
LKKQRFYGEEITSEDLIFVVRHEVMPAERRAALWQGWGAVALDDVGNRLIAHFVTQLQQFTGDLAIAQSFSWANRTIRRSNSASVLGRPPLDRCR